MFRGMILDFDFAAVAELQESQINVLASDGHDGKDRDNRQTALQNLIPGQAKHVKTQVHSEYRVSKAVGTSIVKTQPCIPLHIKTRRENG